MRVLWSVVLASGLVLVGLDVVESRTSQPPVTAEEAAWIAKMKTWWAREEGYRSIQSTNSVVHPTNAIPIDEILATALRNEVSGSGTPGALS